MPTSASGTSIRSRIRCPEAATASPGTKVPDASTSTEIATISSSGPSMPSTVGMLGDASLLVRQVVRVWTHGRIRTPSMDADRHREPHPFHQDPLLVHCCRILWIARHNGCPPVRVSASATAPERSATAHCCDTATSGGPSSPRQGAAGDCDEESLRRPDSISGCRAHVF